VTNTNDKAANQEGYDIMYKAEKDMYTKRKHELKDNMKKKNSLIFLQHCNKAIQDRIMRHPEFKSSIKNDPIKLLKAIKILIDDPVRARYNPYTSVTKESNDNKVHEVVQTAIENESLTDYMKRFKGIQDSLAQNMGKDFLKDFVKNTKQYSEEPGVDKQNQMQDKLYTVSWTAYMLMKNNDQGKYGSLMTSLTTQFSMGTNQYPKNVLGAVNILTNHRFDKREPRNNDKRHKNWNNNNTASTITTQSSFNQEA
jgi:hypothetical protein